jgi:acetyl esterase/lipase
MNNQMIHRVHPELIKPLQMFLNSCSLDLHDIHSERARQAKIRTSMKAQIPFIKGVSSEDLIIPGPSDAPDVLVRIYKPVDCPEKLPVLLWMHGGGYMLGNIEEEDLAAKRITSMVKCVTVTVDYRLAPEHPFPAAIEDCYAVLKWLASHSDDAGIDPNNIAIGGASAGGGLTAGLSLLARDRAEVPITFQLLIYPMLDDCNVALASKAYADTLVWTRENNLIGWRSYLGQNFGVKHLSPYAAAFRATNLKGLPLAYIAVGELDLFMSENVIYAQRLLQAGISTELHVYPGAFHGFDMTAPDASISRRFVTDYCLALSQAFHPKSLT